MANEKSKKYADYDRRIPYTMHIFCVIRCSMLLPLYCCCCCCQCFFMLPRQFFSTSSFGSVSISFVFKLCWCSCRVWSSVTFSTAVNSKIFVLFVCFFLLFFCCCASFQDFMCLFFIIFYGICPLIASPPSFDPSSSLLSSHSSRLSFQ